VCTKNPSLPGSTAQSLRRAGKNFVFVVVLVPMGEPASPAYVIGITIKVLQSSAGVEITKVVCRVRRAKRNITLASPCSRRLAKRTSRNSGATSIKHRMKPAGCCCCRRPDRLARGVSAIEEIGLRYYFAGRYDEGDCAKPQDPRIRPELRARSSFAWPSILGEANA